MRKGPPPYVGMGPRMVNQALALFIAEPRRGRSMGVARGCIGCTCTLLRAEKKWGWQIYMEKL